MGIPLFKSMVIAGVVLAVSVSLPTHAVVTSGGIISPACSLALSTQIAQYISQLRMDEFLGSSANTSGIHSGFANTINSMFTPTAACGGVSLMTGLDAVGDILSRYAGQGFNVGEGFANLLSLAQSNNVLAINDINTLRLHHQTVVSDISPAAGDDDLGNPDDLGDLTPSLDSKNAVLENPNQVSGNTVTGGNSGNNQ